MPQEQLSPSLRLQRRLQRPGLESSLVALVPQRCPAAPGLLAPARRWAAMGLQPARRAGATPLEGLSAWRNLEWWLAGTSREEERTVSAGARCAAPRSPRWTICSRRGADPVAARGCRERPQELAWERRHRPRQE